MSSLTQTNLKLSAGRRHKPESKGSFDLNDGNLAMSRGVGLLCPYIHNFKVDDKETLKNLLH